MDQLVVGGLDGFLAVLDPSAAADKRLVLHKDMERPVLQTAIGRFFPAMQAPLLAVLQPRHLVFCRFVTGSATLYGACRGL